ncbi:MAG: hypothetical protein KAT16_03990 [Candidatus Heimdallarchaeota archaeon]|nr:hypothetical protein [Candidatus Heimdallarchaeota archaeon]
MATRFDSKLYVLNQFKVLAGKYFPQDYLRVNSSKKGFRLSDSTQKLIEKSKTIVSQLEKTNEALPQSTAFVYRYGVVFQAIFSDLIEYQTISSVNARSRRGYRKEMEFLAFDLKKIELELKKSSNPRVKIQKDEKLIRVLKKRYLTLMDEKKFNLLKTEIEKTQPLFILDDSEGFKFFEVLSRSVSSFTQKISHKRKLMKQESEIKSSQKKLRDDIKQSSLEVQKYQKEIELQRKMRGVNDLTKRKETLYNQSDMSLFFKILTTSLERYIKMIERREKQRLEDRDQLLGVIIEPTKFDGLNETLWKQIVFIIETHGIELLNGKSWFKFSFSDDLRDFITRKDILKKFSELRNLERELETIESELYKNSIFSEAYNFIKKFESLKVQLEESEKTLPDIIEEINKLTQIIEDERLRIMQYLY